MHADAALARLGSLTAGVQLTRPDCCTCNRNGLRPARFWRTSDDLVYVASEVGVLNDALDNAPNIIAKGRLGPGQVLLSAAGSVHGEDPQLASILAACLQRLAGRWWLCCGLRQVTSGQQWLYMHGLPSGSFAGG